MARLAQAGAKAGPGLETEQDVPLLGEYRSAMVTRYVARAGLDKAGAGNLLRHTCATLMPEHGADIRHVQEQLGHAGLPPPPRSTRTSRSGS